MFREQGGKALVWVGVVSQVGSALGAIITFSLVNLTHIFVSIEPC